MTKINMNKEEENEAGCSTTEEVNIAKLMHDPAEYRGRKMQG